MSKLFLSFNLLLLLHSCTNSAFIYPNELVSEIERRQYDKAVWLIYKFQYKLPVYKVASSSNMGNLHLVKIDTPFVACEINLKGIERRADTLILDFRSTCNDQQIVHGLKEDDGIPSMSFIGSSDSIRGLKNFFVIHFPQICVSDCDSTQERQVLMANSFVYDSLGDSEFIKHLKTNKKLLSPSLKYICSKRALF